MAKKVLPEPVIRSWEEADAALRAIGELDIEIEKKERLANLKINDIKEKLVAETNGQLAWKSRLEKDLEEFLERYQGELGGQVKSRKLNFGMLGFRLSPPKLKPVAKMTWAKVVEKLKSLGRERFLRYPDPEVDKEALKLAGVETLKEVGVRSCSEDLFWYEVDRQQIEKSI